MVVTCACHSVSADFLRLWDALQQTSCYGLNTLHQLLFSISLGAADPNVADWAIRAAAAAAVAAGASQVHVHVTQAETGSLSGIKSEQEQYSTPPHPSMQASDEEASASPYQSTQVEDDLSSIGLYSMPKPDPSEVKQEDLTKPEDPWATGASLWAFTVHVQAGFAAFTK